MRAAIIKLSRKRVYKALESCLVTGHLTIREGDCVRRFGSVDGGPSVAITVVSTAFWVRLCWDLDLAVSEAYMEGEILVENLRGLMELYLLNREGFERLDTWPGRVWCTLVGLHTVMFGQTLLRAKANSEVSYDFSNEFFAGFLGAEMLYSCPFFSEEDGGPYGDLNSGSVPGDLERAAAAMIHEVVLKARLTRDDKVLEFGTGWAAFAIQAVKETGCEVHTLTLSRPQKALAEKRIEDAGLQDRIHVHLLDYRNLPKAFKAAFDVFVSIEMLEHVGQNHLRNYFSIVNDSLKPRGARAVISTSIRPEARYTRIQRLDFGRKYLWPNASLPSLLKVLSAASGGSSKRLEIHEIVNHGPHYGRALRTWGERFDRNLPVEVLHRILQDRPSFSITQDIERLRRMWIWYFAWAAAGYSQGYVERTTLVLLRPDITLLK